MRFGSIDCSRHHLSHQHRSKMKVTNASHGSLTEHPRKRCTFYILAIQRMMMMMMMMEGEHHETRSAFHHKMRAYHVLNEGMHQSIQEQGRFDVHVILIHICH